MKGVVLLRVVVVGLLVAAYLRGWWPFHDRAIADCAATGDVATCLRMKYGWSESEALVAALHWRVGQQ